MEELFEQLRDDTRSFWQNPSAGIRRLDAMPSPADFFRDFVATSTPVVISGGGSGCLKRESRCWDDVSSLARRNGVDLEVTVDFTPNGRGDCVVDVPCDLLSGHLTSSNTRGGRGGVGEGKESRTGTAEHGDGSAVTATADTTAVFVKPEERRMKFETFVSTLLEAATAGDESCAHDGSRDSGIGEGWIPYLSHQNDSLRREFPGLLEEVEPFLALAREAFGNDPDAVNLWIGDDRSLSAVHKDHYENMYCVVRGEKHFTLLPPSDVLFLYEQEYPQGRYRRRRASFVNGIGGEGDGGGGEGVFEVEMEEGKVPWIPVDPACPDLEKYPLFRFASPVECRVGPGDILYLPSLWYHRVSQRGITVAVNYWHDMQFDHKYVYYRFLQSLATKFQSVVPRSGRAVGVSSSGAEGGGSRSKETPQKRFEEEPVVESEEEESVGEF